MNIELNSRSLHPVLDDPTKMMRIIANPLYDKLTISRAAHMRKYNPDEYTCKLVRLNRRKEKPLMASFNSFNSDETISMTIPTTGTQVQSKSTFGRTNPASHRNNRTENRSTSNVNDRKVRVAGTIRYMKSRHGFEIQRYSSQNWLSVDLLTKDACGSDEKTFRVMLDKQEQDEVISHNMYTLEYYRQRYQDLLQSYKQGHLTHEQWAKQNYQLYCFKTFYTRAYQREKYLLDLHAQKQRQKRAEAVFNQWKEAKCEGSHARHQTRLNTANSEVTTHITSVSVNPSILLPNHTTNRLSISSVVDNELEELSIYQPSNSLKNSTNTLYMLNNQRSSLEAMLKRVVGLADPLPPPPSKNTHRQYSSTTHLTAESSVESGL